MGDVLFDSLFVSFCQTRRECVGINFRNCIRFDQTIPKEFHVSVFQHSHTSAYFDQSLMDSGFNDLFEMVFPALLDDPCWRSRAFLNGGLERVQSGTSPDRLNNV
jgi:hypothetical protein